MSPDSPTSDAAAAAGPKVERVTVVADWLTWLEGRLEAHGHVVIRVGTDVLEAASASGTSEELTVVDGVWTRATGELRFALAKVNLTARSGVLTEAKLVRDGVSVRAEVLTLDAPADRVRAQQAFLEPCECADGSRPALSFRAKDIELLGAEVAIIHGGTVRIFDVPVLPIPYWREPLNPKTFRLLLPQGGWGSLGWFASEHARFGVGNEIIEVGPAWSEYRGGRIDLALAGPVTLNGAAGWDRRSESPRGAVVTRAGFADARRRLAWDVSAQSDGSYDEDYGPSWTDRGVDWHDSRLIGQVGAFRSTAWLPDDGSIGKFASLRFRPEFSRQGWAAAPWAEIGVAENPLARLGTDARASHTWTALHAEAALALAGEGQWAGSAPTAAGFAAAMARVEVPFWAQVKAQRVQFFVGARSEVGFGDALGTPLRIPVRAGELAAGVGPSARASTAAGDTVVSAEAAVLVGVDGAATAALSVDAAGSGWSARTEAVGDRLSMQVQTHGQVGLDVGTLLSPDAQLSWIDLTLHMGRFIVGGGISRGLGPDDPLHGAARIGYDDGCSSLVISGAFSPDRELPDVGLSLALRK